MRLYGVLAVEITFRISYRAETQSPIRRLDTCAVMGRLVVGSTYNLNTKSGELSNVISIDNNLVSRVPSNKCLGVLLDEKLTFETHIDYICKKACAGIGALRRIKPFVPLCTIVTLYRSLIEPYCKWFEPRSHIIK